LVAGSGVLAYELTTTLLNLGLTDTAVAVARGVAGLPTELQQRLGSEEPQVRGEALVDALAIGAVGTAVAAKLGQAGYAATVHNIEKRIAAGAGASGNPLLLGADRAIIDPRKLTGYALNPSHPVGANKARVFQSALGFTTNNADELIAQLMAGLKSSPAVAGKVDQYGARFTVDIHVTGPSGSGTVRTGWIYKVGSDTPELTTLYVK
jgi:filamentous hemagglutinin